VPDGLTGPRNRWQNVGQSVYRCGDVYVWKEDGEWFRATLPPWSMRMALASMRVGPGGLFTKTEGPYLTMREAKKGKREKRA